MRVGAVVMLALATAGCGSATSLVMDIQLGGQTPAPDSLRVTLFGAGLIGARPVPLAAAGRQLPGRLQIAPLDAGQPAFRWLVEGLDAAGAVRSQAADFAALAPGAETRVQVTLGAPLADRDGDGVPDAIDDCPLEADPDQRCPSAPDFGPPPDLIRSDGSPPLDLSGPDLASEPCPVSAILCEGFESGSFATNNWSLSMRQPGDTLAIDGTRAHTGALSLHTGALSSGSMHIASADYPLAGVPAEFAVRQWVYITGDAGPDSFFLQLYTATNGISLGEDQAGHWVFTEDFGSSTADHSTLLAVPFGTWTCLEVVVSKPGGVLRFQAYADNQTVVDFSPAMPYTAFIDFITGYARVPPSSASEVFVDDVVLAPTRVGCP